MGKTKRLLSPQQADRRKAYCRYDTCPDTAFSSPRRRAGASEQIIGLQAQEILAPDLLTPCAMSLVAFAIGFLAGTTFGFFLSALIHASTNWFAGVRHLLVSANR